MFEKSSMSIILKNPKVVWTLLKSKPKILGPWCKCEDKKRNWYHPGAIARFTWDKKYHVVVVQQDKPPRPPDVCDYYVYGGVDDEAYDEAIAEYNSFIKSWKPWHYYGQMGIKIPKEFIGGYTKTKYAGGYADSLEEAKQAIDKILIDNGYLLYNGD